MAASAPCQAAESGGAVGVLSWLMTSLSWRRAVSARPAITIPQLRHSYATTLLAAGEHPEVVAERLGHSSITVTLDIYSAVLPNMQREAVERLARLMDRQGGG